MGKGGGGSSRQGGGEGVKVSLSFKYVVDVAIDEKGPKNPDG